ncbi:MAG: uroporphyrinogen decarboxylase family protein [Oscillospiraceae bacterium]|nr:uroporphyrinogen decarboxylase family protein [Oscillospiraceae bacterium]
MHPQDKMIPKERMAAYLSGKEVDRVPILPFITAVSGCAIGMSHREKRSNAENMAKCQIACYRRFGHDSVSIEYGLHGVGTGMGSKTNDPENNVPAIIDHYLKDLDNLEENLCLEKLSINKDPWSAQCYEAMQLIQKEVGDEVGVSIAPPGPFTAAASLYPVDKLLRACRKCPDKVHQLLRFTTDAVKLIATEYVSAGSGFSICDPVASGSILSKKAYCEFVQPYTQELIDHVHSLGKGVTYHVCGNTEALTEELVNCGCNVLSIDNRVSLLDTKQRVGHLLPIMGNVDPVEVMMLGNPNDVEEAVKACFAAAWDSPKKYMLSTGCGIPIEAPIENIDALMAAGRKYGQWPLDPERFK